MSVTRRLRHAPAAFALVLAALALGWAGGSHPVASANDAGATTVGAGSAGVWGEASGHDRPAVTVGADERVDARADRWRHGGLLTLLAFAVAVPLLDGCTAGTRRRRLPWSPMRLFAVAVRAPPCGVAAPSACAPV